MEAGEGNRFSVRQCELQPAVIYGPLLNFCPTKSSSPPSRKSDHQSHHSHFLSFIFHFDFPFQPFCRFLQRLDSSPSPPVLAKTLDVDAEIRSEPVSLFWEQQSCQLCSSAGPWQPAAQTSHHLSNSWMSWTHWAFKHQEGKSNLTSLVHFHE